jgi:hypothetical protein
MEIPAVGEGAWGLGNPVRNPVPVYYNAPTDLDCSGRGDTDGPATHAGLRAALNEVAGEAKAGDVVLLAITAHGSPDSVFGGGFMAWGERSISVDDLRGMLAILPPTVKVVLAVSACYSGQFTALTAPNRCILTTAPRDETSHTGGPAGYTPLFRALWGGITGVSAYSAAREGPPLTSSYADLDRDGFVDMREIYAQQWETAYDDDTPTSSDPSLGVGETTTGHWLLQDMYRRELRRVALRHSDHEDVDDEGLPAFNAADQFPRGILHLMERQNTPCSEIRF